LFVGTRCVLICLLGTKILLRENSFQVSETVSVHCGVFNENGGFSISDEDNKYMRSCKIVVSACAFGPLVGEITFTNPLDCLRHQLKRFVNLILLNSFNF
ncbi:unnamed protein product, partial [Brassica oleracea var. botrytis]